MTTTATTDMHVAVLYTQGRFTEISFNPGDDIVRDGQMYLLQETLKGRRLQFHPLFRADPMSWGRRTGKVSVRFHPKLIWPYWLVHDVAHRGALASAQLLINASGPLLYSGPGHHSLAEPWHIALRRLLIRRPDLRFLNLAFGAHFLTDPQKRRESAAVRWADRRFVQSLCGRAWVTSCRDPDAQGIMQDAGFAAPLVPCPSLFARDLHNIDMKPRDYVALNFHPAGSRVLHDRSYIDARWIAELGDLVARLRAEGLRMRFVFHEQLGHNLAQRTVPFAMDDVVIPRSIPEYLRVYAEAAVAFTNRIHGTYTAASFGVPSLCMGSDNRMSMIRMLGLPVSHFATATGADMFVRIMGLLRNRESLRSDLNALREQARRSYLQLLRPLAEGTPAA